MNFELTAILLSLNVLVVLCQKDMPEQKLIEKLLEGYNIRVRPVENQEDVVNVTLNFHLTKVVNLDSETHVLTSSGWITVAWADPRLTWEPAEYGNIKRTSLYAGDIWFPDIALENSAGSYYELAHTRSFKVTVYSNGELVWQPGGVYKTYCPITVLYYPFDTQTCDIIFTEWGYNSDEVVLSLGTEEVYMDTGYYQKSGAWRVISTSAKSELHQFETADTFSRIQFTLELNRVYMYYFVTMLFPALVLSGLVLLVYAVPRNLGEKLSMGLTLMLSFFVFMVNISNYVPKSTEVIPLIQIYLLFYMLITAVTVGISVMMLWLNHTKHIQRPQLWLRFLVYRVMANVICYGCCSKKPRFQYFGNEKDVEGNSKKNKHKMKSNEAASLAASNLVELEKLTSDAEALGEGLEEHESPGSSQQQEPTTPGRSVMESINRIKKRLKKMEQGTVDMMSFIWQTGKESDLSTAELEKIKGEWKEITSIINRFSFWVLFTCTNVFILMCVALWVLNG